MTMNGKREGVKHWWGGYHAGNDNRRGRRTARARRKVVAQRETREDENGFLPGESSYERNERWAREGVPPVQ